MSDALLCVNDLKKRFVLGGGILGLGTTQEVDAVSGVSFTIAAGETLALVGESGCGKSTVGRCILRLETPTDGQVVLDGERIDDLSPETFRKLRKRIQVVFQDPFSSLNPRRKIRDILAEPLRNFGLVRTRAECDRKVAELLQIVGLSEDVAHRWPHEFSGGQRQRIGIARALASDPDLIVCDEAVSALDVSVKAQIVNLLKDIQKKTGTAFLFISHDLAIVENISHRVAVMYLGKLAEIAPREAILRRPRHPYTRALMSAVPIPDPAMRRTEPLLKGDVPSPIAPPSGCRFHTRCPFVEERCRTEVPELRPVAAGHLAACHLNDLADGENPLLSAPPVVA
ncbi:ABC transporter ATP-binding protein [Acuticoccus mangrovi]|uniref:ATP-binding cassette domain-containing protein n=1 Tax=Acuticoccus mangrovi TaxID=2796142 RepID=A0A934IU03_9HYPH|nr:oligopeptide/dipeptide ABC transporter ATP-binding protein [Acuticoccus mangrovi]MBJ3778147.1 ATP-binding cassette domain-containing protein [Acuticoccus mangrovi]